MRELNRHYTTMKFLSSFHGCLHGIEPGFIQKLLVSKSYMPIFNEASTIAKIRKTSPENMPQLLEKSLENIFSSLQALMFKRLNFKLKTLSFTGRKLTLETAEEYITKMELPATLRNLFGSRIKKGKKGVPGFNIGSFLDGLTFPFFASVIISAAYFTSSRVMYKSRPMLEKFSQKLGTLDFPKRMLWLANTFEDDSDMSVFLRQLLNEIKRRNLPIDILICSENIKPEDHLIVMKPQAVYNISLLNRQLRIPNLLHVKEKFRVGEYDRIMCSSEDTMGLLALYLKLAYSVPAYFLAHEDWMSFAKNNLNFSNSAIAKIRRVLRFFYKSFDKVFVLNDKHKKWFLEYKMSFNKSSVKQISYLFKEAGVVKSKQPMADKVIDRFLRDIELKLK